MITSALCGTALAIGAYVAPQLARLVQERNLRRCCAATRSLVLTYDDGPGRHLTPQLLDLLEAHGVRATFFPLGFRAEASPFLLDRAVAAGHEVGCHGFGHIHAWRHWPWQAISDMSHGYHALARWAGTTGAFRPPYGKITLPTWVSLCMRGATLGWWTVSSRDVAACHALPQVVVETVVQHGGGVVLMHDFDRSAEEAQYVLSLTELLLQCARREDLRVCRLCDLAC